MDNPASPRQRAGRYEVRQVLGQGGMGLVYRAYDTVVRREVAVKTILDIPDPASLQLFYKECDVLASMSHPISSRSSTSENLVKIPHKSDKKSFRTLQVRVGLNEITARRQLGGSGALASARKQFHPWQIRFLHSRQ